LGKAPGPQKVGGGGELFVVVPALGTPRHVAFETGFCLGAYLLVEEVGHMMSEFFAVHSVV